MEIVNALLNHPDTVALILGTLGGLIWHRGKKSAADDLRDTLLKVGRQAFTKLLTDPRLYDDAYVREQISKAIWAGLTRMGVKKTPGVMKLVDEAVEVIHGELAEKVMDYHLSKLQKPLQGAADAISKLPEDKAIEPAAEPTA